jgi:hypothetical protein
MLLRFISLVCTLLFMLQVSVNTYVYIRFKVNQEYIVKELCVQRKNAVNTCNGHCYLKIQLKEHNDEAATNTFSYVKDKVELFCNVHEYCFFNKNNFVVNIYSDGFIMGKERTCIFNIFRPPVIVAV